MWSGNITLKIDDKEDTYLLDSTEVKRYAKDAVALKITSKEQWIKAVIPLSRQECKRLVDELTQSLLLGVWHK
jgi:hypothetical protein